MRPLVQHASRSLFQSLASINSSKTTRSTFGTLVKSASQTSTICLQCRFRTFSPTASNKRGPSSIFTKTPSFPRSFTTSNQYQDKSSDPSKPDVVIADSVEPPSKPETPPKSEDNIKRVPNEDLPSHRAGQRWDLSKRFSDWMDNILPKLAVVTQKVNNYTGTDYSGIEALRQEIKDQELLVKARRSAIEEAKRALDAAHAQQASSQKEVVGLLERKHSWSAADLERYMSLIRSEHLNDQAVAAAKESVQTAETALEEARTRLEKRERAQYHEEQIWSDTIRRNSTWVTFGLMGFNILLLLTSLIAIEPWRRRRIVREIRNALEEKKAVAKVTITPEPALPVEAAADAVIASVDKAAEQSEPQKESVAAPAETLASASPTTPVPELVSEPSQKTGPPAVIESAETSEVVIEEKKEPSNALQAWSSSISAAIHDLFSERLISVRKLDLTAATLEGAAAGALMSGILIMLIRPS